MYWFLGGDERSRRAVEYLQEQGKAVQSYGVPGLPNGELPSYFPRVILPVPSLKEGKIPGCPSLSVEELLRRVDGQSRIYCMKADPLVQQARALGIPIWDLYDTEPYTTQNACATAEAAIALAIENSPITLFDALCLVIGGGRIGVLLCQRLKAMGAKVTLCSRRNSQRALAEGMGLNCDKTGVYEKGLEQYDFVFNTVPATVLTETQLAQLKVGCVLMELASAPGGFDPHSTHMPVFVSATGLPGKYSPKSAGLYYARAIMEQEASI